MPAPEIKDVEMKDAAAAAAPVKKELSPAEVQDVVFADVRHILGSIKRGVSSNDTRLVAKVVRQLGTLRKKIWADTLIRLLESFLPADHAQKAFLIHSLKKAPSHGADVAMTQATPAAVDGEAGAKSLFPECEVYLQVLALMVLIDNKLYADAVTASTALVSRVQSWNRRSMDLLASKVFFYYARSYELADRTSEIRSALLAAYRTAVLRRDDINQAVLLNLLLRNYLLFNLYEQADLLVSKTTFPTNAANPQAARHHYYLGRIHAVQLQYEDAYRDLLQASRKAPQHDSTLGFRVAVNKLLIVVELLLGEVPERGVFRQPGLSRPLRPYLALTSAVRVGDLQRFQKALDQFGDVYRADKTHTLILRLRQNVIRTGLRKINAAYSSIRFADIATKLHLDSADAAEGIVAKAIADGVIAATIDHDGGFVRAHKTPDVYGTHQPAAAFDKRIGVYTDVTQTAIRSMTFPADMKAEGAETAEERRHRLAEEQELAQSLEDDDLDDDF